MKDLLVGMVAGAALGIAVASSPCGKKALKKMQCKMEKACDCAEDEINRVRQDISNAIEPDGVMQ